ncbi:MAG: bifunctional diaminohydroxyphosphoribosylaminopyrimidine deaminase/5-amino-6-(5-phosphoribosylamino)uracil reductase RibD [Bacteroidales bacterium]|nr:bifunctional diaminohydroxyphosphoribosylaminopyrimidine deaminase/5-amino-6-(5-phosphoribosylamino)uracil reductase RibD [Bacteroidales bacterium]
MISREDEKYMSRCIELAQKGIRNVAPNPMVGSVIVHDGKIIGEGYHQKYGEAHAEVNAVKSVNDKSLLKESTLYVSLEPCAHVGKTPSCAKMITELEIPKVVIGSIDPYFKVAGKGIEILKSAKIEVITGVLEKECINLNKRFYTYHQKKRPYIILKWAKTRDGFIDYIREPGIDTKAAWITNEHCKTLVHKLRTEEDAFMVGTNTVILDNPQLTARKWAGKNPLRITIDLNCQLDNSYKIFDDQAHTVVFNNLKDENKGNISYIKLDFTQNIIPQILEVLYELEIQSLVVEGGSQTLETFISLGLWDEALVFTGNSLFIKGVKSPFFANISAETKIFGDSKLELFYNNEYV